MSRFVVVVVAAVALLAAVVLKVERSHPAPDEPRTPPAAPAGVATAEAPRLPSSAAPAAVPQPPRAPAPQGAQPQGAPADVGTEAQLAAAAARAADLPAYLDALARLRTLGTDEAVRALAELAQRAPASDRRRLALQELGRCASPQAAAALRAIASSDADARVRGDAAAAFAATGQANAAELQALLRGESDSGARRAIAQAMTREGSVEAARVLRDEARRAPEAVDALRAWDEPRGYDVLAECVRTETGSLLAACVTALGRVDDERAVALLAPLVAPPRDPGLRGAAIVALGMLGRPAAIPALEPIARSGDALATSAQQALARIRFVAGKLD